MFSSLSYNQKGLFLFIGFALFLYIGYTFIFSDTFKLVSELKEKEEKIVWLKEQEKGLPALKAKLNAFEKAYAKSDSISVRDKLTAFISDYAENNGCLVTEIPHNSSYKNDNLRIQTNTFTVRGSFIKLLPLVNQLETECKYLAKIISVKFYTIRDLQKRKKELFVTIIAQTFEQKLNENEKK